VLYHTLIVVLASVAGMTSSMAMIMDVVMLPLVFPCAFVLYFTGTMSSMTTNVVGNLYQLKYILLIGRLDNGEKKQDNKW
jgi:ribulose 1,5-bisphosphate carboxylase large subunit-like protein